MKVVCGGTFGWMPWTYCMYPNLVSLPPLFRHWRDMLFMFKQFFIQTGLHYLHQCWASRSSVTASNPYTCPRPDSCTKPRNRYWQHSRPTDMLFSRKIWSIGKPGFQTPSGKSSVSKDRSNLGHSCLVLFSELKLQTSGSYLWTTSFWMARRRVEYFVCSTRNLIAYLFKFLSYFD